MFNTLDQTLLLAKSLSLFN